MDTKESHKNFILHLKVKVFRLLLTEMILTAIIIFCYFEDGKLLIINMGDILDWLRLFRELESICWKFVEIMQKRISQD
jgi:hypothetical protein